MGFRVSSHVPNSLSPHSFAQTLSHSDTPLIDGNGYFVSINE
jgi:hypothetical protein